MNKPTTDRPAARLALEDGTVFHGAAFGACQSPHSQTGEVVFNTAMCGYQEALTDPSYSGQILTMTATQVGNYGISREDVESGKPQVAGFVIRELSRVPSNYRSYTDLSSWLAEHGVIGIEGIDTRALVRRLRTRGAMRGVISCDPTRTDADLVAMANAAPVMSGQNLACVVSPRGRGEWGEGLGEWTGRVATDAPPGAFHVVSLDCGAKRNIYRHLAERGCRITILPFDTPPAQIRALKPDGLFISNGPGDPEAVEATVATLREIAGEVPTFGICLGHQLLALSMGARTYKLKFGHRGANQPIRNLMTGRVEITSQNHGFCVDPDSLPPETCEVTHLHLNDGTVAGFRHRTRPIFSVQYHPEASPGPHDSAYLFDCFIEMMRTGRPLDAHTVDRLQAQPV
ncbi:MAG: glutamine-hydrolyzing carbamoyl-phosphate synthase small subunit [Phycisphaeraceae bacterium]|nr:glutamine-hydrolyzing carbamoyl-phosphate synthase small subunit [Phycisphaerales bacterium]QOJ17622.1 MAG: glutamine-hydrolyzing carbamoyl-phosphate synthase small subunit [Phycisphaeraceae bacterium]